MVWPNRKLHHFLLNCHLYCLPYTCLKHTYSIKLRALPHHTSINFWFQHIGPYTWPQSWGFKFSAVYPRLQPLVSSSFAGFCCSCFPNSPSWPFLMCSPFCPPRTNIHPLLLQPLFSYWPPCISSLRGLPVQIRSPYWPPLPILYFWSSFTFFLLYIPQLASLILFHRFPLFTFFQLASPDHSPPTSLPYGYSLTCFSNAWNSSSCHYIKAATRVYILKASWPFSLNKVNTFQGHQNKAVQSLIGFFFFFFFLGKQQPPV